MFRLVRPLQEPSEDLVVENDFIVDRTRNLDFKATFKQSWPIDETHRGEGTATEKRSGGIVESLHYDQDGRPKEGFINYAKDAIFNSLGLENDPFCYRSDIFVGTNGTPEGFYRIPLSEMMKDPDRVYSDGQIEDVEGQRCLKFTCLYQMHDRPSQMVAFVWLGVDINLTIVKQQTLFVPGEKSVLWNYNDFRKSYPTVKAIAETFIKRRPMTLVVGRNFVELQPSVWVASEIDSYALWYDDALHFPDPESITEFRKLNALSEHTKDFSEEILLGFDRSFLDIRSVKINEDIDPHVFEDSIFPKGIRVSNVILGFYPNDQQLEQMIPSEKDLALGENQSQRRGERLGARAPSSSDLEKNKRGATETQIVASPARAKVIVALMLGVALAAILAVTLRTKRRT
jgi:hypothetical protein